MLKRFISYLMFACLLSACASEPHFWALEDAEKAHNKKQRETSLVLMDLDEIFPDPQVRALAKAAGRGDIKKIRELVANGVDVNAQGRSTGTPLFWAIYKGNLEGFEELLKQGATPNVKLEGSSTVMHWATRNKDSRFLQLALAYGGDPNLKGGMFDAPPIEETVELGGKTIPRNYYLLIEAGTDLNIKTNTNATLLTQAAGRRRYDIVLDLLNRGAEFQMVNRRGIIVLFDWLAEHERVMDKNEDAYKQKKKVEQWLQDRNIDFSIITPGSKGNSG
ncbi:ankyrin repeat domain-containing protein [Shewanella sp. SM29]|uniref:ankyrin repeat domain-containing protein n=1 Tax=Shewanella sp. SM29 TaxID=2912795 RepID=UPI0021D9AB63|nr:ankyrin repeat domain-containing protein [Shewanella sp. SM29]MCU8073881.1 ankyrin repeat domain-containing protein [Shewanella sp. SM29]